LNNIGLLAVYVIGFIAIFYFLAIRPQQRQRKAHEELVSSVKRGDRVVSIGGIHGTVKRVEEGIVVVEVAKGVEIKISRRAVAEISREPEKSASESKKVKTPAQIEPAEENDEEQEADLDEAEETPAEEPASEEQPKQ
jgi:preprotein translocase subunit YajC